MIDGRTGETKPMMRAAFIKGYRAAFNGRTNLDPNWPWTWYREGYRLGKLLGLRMMTDADLGKMFDVIWPQWQALCKANFKATEQPAAEYMRWRPNAWMRAQLAAGAQP